MVLRVYKISITTIFYAVAKVVVTIEKFVRKIRYKRILPFENVFLQVQILSCGPFANDSLKTSAFLFSHFIDDSFFVLSK